MIGFPYPVLARHECMQEQLAIVCAADNIQFSSLLNIRAILMHEIAAFSNSCVGQHSSHSISRIARVVFGLTYTVTSKLEVGTVLSLA